MSFKFYFERSFSRKNREMDDETRHQLWNKVAKRFARVIGFSVVTIVCFPINFIFVSLGIAPQPIIPSMKLCVQVHALWKLHGVEGSNKEISRFVKVALGATGRQPV